MSAGEVFRQRAELLDELERLRAARVKAQREEEAALEAIEGTVERGVDLGLTLAELALAAGVSRPTLYARGVRRHAA